MIEPHYDIRLGNRVIRRQPPVMFLWCKTPGKQYAADPVCARSSVTCAPGSKTCAMCGFPYCPNHLAHHLAARNRCPVDVWRGFGQRLRAWQKAVSYKGAPPPQLAMLDKDGRVIRDEPPIVGAWCRPPNARHSREIRCVYPAKTCTTGSETCLLCGFPFCTYHMKRHIRRFQCPKPEWLLFEERRKRWFRLVESGKRRKPRVAVHFEMPQG